VTGCLEKPFRTTYSGEPGASTPPRGGGLGARSWA
jgi:hypothetical protein